MNIPILLGTTRKGNHSSKVATFLYQQLSKNSGIQTQILDLGKANFPIFEERIGRADNLPPLLEKWSDMLTQADGIIIVTPEYKNGYPGALKNFLDYLPSGVFLYKPVGISSVTSGTLGGTNALAQLRLVTLSLKGMPIPDRFMVSQVDKAFDENGNPTSEKLPAQASKFLNELVKYATAFSSI